MRSTRDLTSHVGLRDAIRWSLPVLALTIAFAAVGHGSAYAAVCVKYVEGASADSLVYSDSDAAGANVSVQGVPSGGESSNDHSHGPGYEISTHPVSPGCVKPPCRVEQSAGAPDPTYVFCQAREGTPQAVQVSTAQGPDSVTLWDQITADVTINTRHGDDDVGLDVFLPGTAAEGAYSVSTGPGDDNFHVGVCERLYYRAVDLEMGPGHDTAFVGPGESTVTTGCQAAVDLGPGDDAIETWSFGEVHGGPGDDTITSHGTNGFRRNAQGFFYDGGPGADQIFDFTRSAPASPDLMPVRIQGGPGPDFIDGHGSPLFDPGNADPGTFGVPDDIDCGPGRDTAVVYARDTRTGCERG
jgi:hypothetical protein